jgi:hypothetical protein
MALRQYKSRIHLLAARKAPTIAILQRKRSKLFHVIVIDTEALRITEGSWFRGKLYPKRCDVSFDGKFMVYLAMGASGKTWNGVCRLPWLTTVIERLGENWGEERKLTTRTYQIECVGDDGWSHRPSRQHPELSVRFVGYLAHGYTFAFSLNEHPHLLEGALWATWDVSGNLWVAWPGVVSRFTLTDLRKGTPSFSLDVDRFEPPSIEAPAKTNEARRWHPLLPVRRSR